MLGFVDKIRGLGVSIDKVRAGRVVFVDLISMITQMNKLVQLNLSF
jgi:hypothetical protein